MIIEIHAKRGRSAGMIDAAILIDGVMISGLCGLTIPELRFQEFIDRISPDTINESEYIPNMPIELERV